MWEFGFISHPPFSHADDVRELFGGWEFAFEFAGELRLQMVGGDADGIGLGAQGILDFHIVLLGAEDDADGGVKAEILKR